MYQYPSNSEVIKRHKTSVDKNNKYKEYLVYEKDGVFITSCIDWKIKSPTKSGGTPDFYEEYKTEKEAVSKYEEIISSWEQWE
jgi:hypothetical protein